MNDDEKQRLIKEIRLVVLRDVHTALTQLEEQSDNQELSRIASVIGQHINERAAAVANDTADRPRQPASRKRGTGK